MSFSVTTSATNGKPVCDFLFMNNDHLHHAQFPRYRVLSVKFYVSTWSALFNAVVRGEPLNVMIGLKKLETSFYVVM